MSERKKCSAEEDDAALQVDTSAGMNHADDSSSGESPRSILHADVSFPPDEEGLSTLIDLCNKAKLPAYFGHNVSMEEYNEWLLNSTTGLRVSYDEETSSVLVREGCYQSHETTRAAFLIALDHAFSGHGYDAGLGQIETPVGNQNITADVFMDHNAAPGYPITAEVSQSQSIDDLNTRAHLILSTVNGAAVVILMKIWDSNDAENGRMAVWCARHDGTGALNLTDAVEFGRVGPGGAHRPAWVAGTAPPTFVVPAHLTIPATTVNLDGILTKLRRGNKWKHAPPP